MKGLLDALGLFSVVAVPARGSPSRRATLWLPVVGLLVALASFGPALAVWRGGSRGAPLLAAVLVVAGQALLTRGLHLDGLADLADGLGSRRPAAGALAVMRQPDVGPFGVAAVLLDVLVQVAALAAVLAHASRPLGAVAVASAAVAGRVAVVLAARPSVPAARPDGFGALAARTVSRTAATTLAAAAIAGTVAAHRATGVSLAGAAAAGVAVVVALAGAAILRAHAVRRLGGVTGDVFGALVEVASALTLVGLAVATTWR